MNTSTPLPLSPPDARPRASHHAPRCTFAPFAPFIPATDEKWQRLEKKNMSANRPVGGWGFRKVEADGRRGCGRVEVPLPLLPLSTTEARVCFFIIEAERLERQKTFVMSVTVFGLAGIKGAKGAKGATDRPLASRHDPRRCPAKPKGAPKGAKGATHH